MLLSKLLSRFDYQFDFMSQRRVFIAALFSTILIIGSFVAVFGKGLNFGLDFTGGTLIEVSYDKPVELPDIRRVLDENGYHGAIVQHFGRTQDVMIRLPPIETGEKTPDSKHLSSEMLKLLHKEGQEVTMRRVEFVGPQVGGELIESGALAILYTMIGILIYVALRFELRFAVGAVVAALHDPILIVGIFALTGLEFDLTVLAAILAVIGYSLNDTVVVFDRIRDNFLKMRKVEPRQVMNLSINQTLSRTIMTSFTTQLAVLSLLFIGGELIRGFAVALTIGIVVGTYSSIYIASTLALALGVSKADMMPIVKEGALVDNHP